MTTSTYEVGDMIRQRGNSIPYEIFAVKGNWLVVEDTPGRKPIVLAADEVEMVPDQTLPEAAAALAEAWRNRDNSGLDSLYVEIEDLIRASDLVELANVCDRWSRNELHAEYQTRVGVAPPTTWHDDKVKAEILAHARRTCTPWETAV